jgi:ribose transport system permease protein
MTLTDTKEKTAAGAPASASAVDAISFRARPTTSGLANKYGLVGVWILVIIIFSALKPDIFLTSANASNILGSQSVIVVLTLGVLFPMASGDFDMSIASTLTLSAMITALLNVDLGWPIGAAIGVALLTGAVIGLINGLVTTRLGIDPFIVTLGVGTFANGVTLWISGSNTISGVSTALVNGVVGIHIVGIPIEFFYALALCAIIWWLFEYTRRGRLFTIVGQGREVARLSGIRVRSVRTLALTLSGLLGALAGVMYVGNSGAADPTSGTQLLLPAFAGAFLGATVIKPGRFNPWGSIIAVYFLVTGISGLPMLGAASFVQDLFYGAALVLAVAISRLMRRNRGAEGGLA